LSEKDYDLFVLGIARWKLKLYAYD
jgi:hypothetical protein